MFRLSAVQRDLQIGGSGCRVQSGGSFGRSSTGLLWITRDMVTKILSSAATSKVQAVAKLISSLLGLLGYLDNLGF